MGKIRWQHKWSPPPWSRHVTPWKLLVWIDRHYDTCWTSLVLWKMYGSDRGWWPSSSCFKPFDYCGKYNGKPLPEVDDGPMIRFVEKEQP